MYEGPPECCLRILLKVHHRAGCRRYTLLETRTRKLDQCLTQSQLLKDITPERHVNFIPVSLYSIFALRNGIQTASSRENFH